MKPQLRLTLLLLLLLVMGGSAAYSQSAGKNDFPVPFGSTNVGKEFYFSMPTNYEDPSATQQYIRLYITSAVKTRVNIWVGESFKKTLNTIPYDVVTYDLTKFEAQVVNRGNSDPVPDDQVFKKKAIYVEADAPIVLYVMNRTSFTSDGMLALPVNGLGQEYVVASATDAISGFQNYLLPSQYVIAAPYDGTIVTIKHAMDSPNHPASGDPFTINLDRGDVFSSMSSEFNGDMSGTYIYSNKPIAVMAGENCTFLPDYRYYACDHLVEMMLPVSAWGKFYHSMPYATRLKGDLYRVFAGEDNAKVYINGQLYATLPTKGGSRGGGWIEYLPPNREPMEFTSDKPIYVAQYNNSQDYDGIQTDPFYCVLTPVEQYQKEFIFTTPGKDFQTNYINLVCDSLAFWDIEIAPGGTDQFQKLWQLKGGDFRIFKSKINGLPYVGKTFDISPGTYRIRGPRPFAAYIYGFDRYDSYGYPLSASVADLSKPDKDAPQVTWTRQCDGTVDGITTDYPEDDKIRTDLVTIWPDYDTTKTYNYELTVDPLFTPGMRTTTFKLRVIDKTKDAQAIFVVSDRAGNYTVDTVNYVAFNVAVTPNPTDFGNLILGDKVTKTLTITNHAARPAEITAVQLLKGTVGFKILTPIPAQGIILGPTGSPTATTTIDVEFTAVKGGTYIDSVGVADTCGLHYLAEVRAKVGAPIINVSDKDWGPVVVGTLAPGQIIVSNVSTDGGDLTVTGASGPSGYPGSNPPIFTTPDGLPAFPFTLKPAERKTLNVTFQPDAVADFTDQIVFNHNAPPNPLNDSIGVLTGKGIQAVLYATSYDWDLHRVKTGPYAAKVYLVNAGTSTVRVFGIKSSTGDNGDFQVVNPNVLTGTDITPGDSLPLDVTFNPQQVGDRQLEIVYDHNSNQTTEVKSILQGKGTVPGLKTTDLDFGTMRVDSRDSAQTVRFELVFDPKYPDTVAITEFRFTSDQAGGNADFRMDPQPSVVLSATNPYVDITGYFRAQTTGTRTAVVSAITNDGVDTTSHWTGVGVFSQPAITGTGDQVRNVCINDSAALTVILENTGSDTLHISGLRMQGPGNEFTIVSPNPSTPFPLAPGARRLVVIIYRPSAVDVVQPDVLIVSNDSPTPEYEVGVSGSGVKFDVPIKVELSGTKDGKVELGKEMTVKISVENDLTPIQTSSYTVTLTYDPVELQPRGNQAVLGSLNPAGAVVTVNPQSTKGTLILDVTSPTPLNGSGALLTVPFGVLFSRETERSITSAQLVLNDAQCATSPQNSATIAVDPVCGLNIRLIEISSASYALDQNTPNPFNPVTKINYSLGLDGQTKMLLYDDGGRLVQQLFDEYQQPGKYELTLDVSNLPSGKYYYTLISGTWSQTKMMVVLK